MLEFLLRLWYFNVHRWNA